VTAALGSGTTLAISGYIRQSAVTQDNIQHHVRVGTILERESDGTQVQVSSIAGITDGSSTWDATVAEYGNSAGGNVVDDSGAVTWVILGEPWTDATDVTDTRALDRFFRECGTEIFAESFEILETRKNTKYEEVNNEVEHQMKALVDRLKQKIGYSLLRSLPYYSSGYKYGNATQRPTLTGLWGWAVITQSEYANTNVYVNKSSAELVKEDIDDLVKAMWVEERANFNSGDWYIACHPYVHQYISEFDNAMRDTTRTDKTAGYMVTRLMTKIGKEFPVLPDIYMRPGVLHVCNASKFEHGYYSNDDIHRKELATQGRYQRWLVSFQKYGLVARSPRQNLGTIYGIAYS
jgi:hypothetical protein